MCLSVWLTLSKEERFPTNPREKGESYSVLPLSPWSILVMSSPGYKLSCEGHNIPSFVEPVFLGRYVISGHNLGTH